MRDKDDTMEIIDNLVRGIDPRLDEAIDRAIGKNKSNEMELKD